MYAYVAIYLYMFMYAPSRQFPRFVSQSNLNEQSRCDRGSEMDGGLEPTTFNGLCSRDW